MTEVEKLLEDVAAGAITPDDALLKIKAQPYTDIGYAKVDLHRQARQGYTEVVYGEGKTAEQICGIISALVRAGQDRVLITRLDPEKAAQIEQAHPIHYDAQSRCAFTGQMKEPDGIGYVLVVTAGTSDIPVAEEAALTCEFFGSVVKRAYDMGVSGLHRTLDNLDLISGASVIIALAGMEGALVSVIGGLADCPVIAVPTSVGYGASFGGIAALLSMLNSCASGVSVVNIDNGFGAGYLANMINHMR